MGRGRAKAKQTRVARDLKYRPMNTDFSALERELRGADEHSDIPERYADYEASDEDEYGEAGGDAAADIPSVRFG